MAVWSIVKYSELGPSNRIDPDYYEPKYIESDNALSSFDILPLGLITNKIDVGHVGPMVSEYCDDGVILLQTQNTREFFPELQNAKRITLDFHKRLKKSQVHKGDILIARSGSFGEACVYPFDEVVNSADIIVVEPRKETIDSLFLVAFLNSSFGRNQLYRFASGGVQGHINLTILESLKVPLFPKPKQETISNLITIALKNKLKSESLLASAEEMLLGELGLDRLELPKAKWNVRNYSETKEEGRMDGEYFEKRYDVLIDYLNSIGVSKLNEIAEIPIKKRFKGKEGKIYNYIEISDIDISNGTTEHTERLYEDLPANAKLKFKGDELIISKVRPTRGAISILLNLGDNAVCSGAFTMAIIDSPLREVVFTWLRSFYGKTLLERPCTGGQYPTITDDDVANVLIPNMSNELAREISDKVSESHSARKEAKELLEEAKQKVEEMILG